MTRTSWSKVTVGEIASVKTGPFGSALHESDYRNTGTPIVTVEHLSERGLVHRNLPLVGAEDVRRLSAYRCRAGDILFSRVGSVDRNSLVSLEEDGWLFSGRLLRVRIDPRRVHPPFLSQLFGTERFKETVRSVAVGQTMPSLNTQILKGISLYIPDLVVQRSIADALQAADETITSIERLIIKKQAIKQGMMQQLLTGRTRLPGFNQEWVDVRAGDLGNFRGGSGFAPRYQGAGSGPIPFFKVSDMNSDGNELFMSHSNNYVTEAQRNSMGAVLMPEEAIVFAKVGAAVYLERKRILTVPSCIDNNMAAYSVDKSRVDVRFMHYVLSAFPMSSLVATGALPSLNGGQLRSIPISLPTELDEQKAIVAFLTDSDFEIDALRARLAKARDIKTGMMQQLLTGRTRLPVEAAS